MAEIRFVSPEKAADWVRSLKPSMAIGTLLSGDRWSCVDKVALAIINQEIVGLATMAFQGEQMDGRPTIVAIYVQAEYRASGIGYQLLETAIDYMASKKMEPIHVDVLNTKVSRMISRLPAAKQQKLNVFDQTMGGMLDAVLEA